MPSFIVAPPLALSKRIANGARRVIDQATLLKTFERDGRVWLRNAIPSNELREIDRLLSLKDRPGSRISNAHPLVETIASSAFTKQLKSLWPLMRVVRVVSFDKNSLANWGVPWHQDRVIVVNERADISNFSNWSCKSGAWHCEPPPTLLEMMLFVRVHIDPSTAENGAMEIALGSHRAGKVQAENAYEIAANCKTELTVANPGDVLILAMLMLHRSLPSKSEDRRRVVRVDYASRQLPEPLAWAS